MAVNTVFHIRKFDACVMEVNQSKACDITVIMAAVALASQGFSVGSLCAIADIHRFSPACVVGVGTVVAEDTI